MATRKTTTRKTTAPNDPHERIRNALTESIGTLFDADTFNGHSVSGLDTVDLRKQKLGGPIIAFKNLFVVPDEPDKRASFRFHRAGIRTVGMFLHVAESQSVELRELFVKLAVVLVTRNVRNDSSSHRLRSAAGFRFPQYIFESMIESLIDNPIPNELMNDERYAEYHDGMRKYQQRIDALAKLPYISDSGASYTAPKTKPDPSELMEW